MAGLFLGYVDPMQAGAASIAPALGSRVMSQLLLPIDQYLSAEAAVSSYIAHQQAWQHNPCMLPPPDALLELAARNWFPDSFIIDNALRQHGIHVGPEVFQEPQAARERKKLWASVIGMKQKRPDPMWILDAYRRGLLPSEDRARKLMDDAGGSWNELTALLPTLRERPGVGMILGAWAEGRFDNEVADRFLTAAGTDLNLWTDARDWLEQPPSIGEIAEGMRRGILPVGAWSKWLGWHRHTDPDTLQLYEELTKGIPGISDLLRMGSRLLFSPELAGRYGLYDGFQEESRPWFARLGLNYPVGFNIPVDGAVREATLPDLYWGATREILPLGIAYAAYQRLRPSQIPKYRDEVPNLRDFSIDDLRLHMRVAGYPPPMQDYLIALSHPPLGRRDIPQVMQHTGRDADWAYGQYLNLGLRSEDARIVADTQYARVHAHDTAWIKSLRDGARKATVKETEGLYDEGIIDRGQALSNLSGAGLPEDLSVQLLDLSDARRARGLLRAAVTATGRDYLSGALSAADALSALSTYGIHRERAGELMQIWTIRRSRRRRQADTSRIIRWVGEGRIGVDDALNRLSNLGWTNPDILLLVGEGEAKLAALRAKAEASAEKAAANRAKELERLSRETDAEARRQRAEANRVAPRSSLLRWLTDGVITRDDFYALMRDRGYPEEDIDRYYTDATTPRPPRPKVLPAEAARPKPAGSAHPSASLLRRWAKEKIIDRVQFREGLSTLGFSAEDIQRFEEEEYGQPSNGEATAQP